MGGGWGAVGTGGKANNPLSVCVCALWYREY
jgi:hypothetical protein